jgi:alpha-tubulin suppressor-like RCC1 family protein
MRRLQLLSFVAPLLGLFACHDATSPLRVAGPRAPQHALHALAIPTTVAQIRAGGYHTCGLKTDGRVVCWGRNDLGEATVPAGLASVAQLSTGEDHTCALKTDGTVVCWGYNFYGEASVPAGLAPVAQV